MTTGDKTTETQPTPTPYMVQRLNHAHGETWIQIGFMDGGREIGPLAELVGGAVKHDAPVWHPVAVMKYLVASDAQVLANAEFIVRACNSYDTMLEVLKDADRLLGYFHWDSSTGRTDKFEMVQRIREAIALAR